MADDLEFRDTYEALKEEIRKALIEELEFEIKKAAGEGESA